MENTNFQILDTRGLLRWRLSSSSVIPVACTVLPTTPSPQQPVISLIYNSQIGLPVCRRLSSSSYAYTQRFDGIGGVCNRDRASSVIKLELCRPRIPSSYAPRPTSQSLEPPSIMACARLAIVRFGTFAVREWCFKIDAI